MKHVVRRETHAKKADGLACLRTALCLLVTVLLAMCMATLVPSVATATNDALEAESTESVETEPTPDETPEMAEESTTSTQQTNAPRSLSTNSGTEFNVKFPATTNTKSDLQVVLNYSDDLFATKSDTYNDDLAYASVCLAAAAGNSNEQAEYKNKSSNVANFLENVGCSDIYVNDDYQSKPTEQSIGVAVGYKNISVNEGGADKTYKLFVVGVRGIAYEAEWASNFRIGDWNDHEGFAEGRDHVLEVVLPYIEHHTSAGDNIKIWIAGYSRAGAVANLVGGWIDIKLEGETSLGSGVAGNAGYDLEGRTFSANDVYCYTTSAPQGAAMENVNAYNWYCVGVHNLINPDDWVAQVPMSWWNFGRYGTDHDLSSPGHAAVLNRDIPTMPNRSETVKAMIERLKKINSGAAYTSPWFKQYYLSVWQGGAVEDAGGDGNAYISQKVGLAGHQGRYFEEFGLFLCDALSVNARSAFVTTYQDDFSYLAWLFMGLPVDASAKFGTTFKAHLTSALRTKLDDPEISLDNLGARALLILNLVKNDLPGLTEVCTSAAKGSLDELGVAYDEDRLTAASATMAKAIHLIVEKESSYFYHLMTVAKAADGIAQAHYPESALAWWEGSDKAPVQPKEQNKLTLRFYDNKDDSYTPENNQLVFSQEIYEGDVVFFSDEEPPTIDNEEIDDGVTYYVAPTREGYRFIGWETKPAEENPEYSEYYAPEDSVYYGDFEAEDIQSGTCNLYAIWAMTEDSSSSPQMVFQDGMAQPVFNYSNAKAEDYTNANSELWRFCVYVESDYDTDLDGKCDLVKVYVQVPRAAVESGEGGWKAPVLYEARPYNAGLVSDLNDKLGFGALELDDEALAQKPPKRVATSSMDTAQLALDTTRSNPQVWNYNIPMAGGSLPENYTFYDYYLVRGYAIVQTAGPGSYGSEGLVCTGTEMERDAFAGVIEWINGKRAAFVDKEGTISVSASDWASGKVGMIGHSYAGSVAYEVATTGVDGLETIIPEAGTTSWYGYVNSQGICTEKSMRYDYMNYIAAACTSRLAIDDGTDPSFGSVLERCKQYRSFVRNQQVQLKGDFGPFWEAREWSTKTDNINASALIVAGLNDDNVTMKHADYIREAILASGQNAKVILHQNAHELPFDRDDAVDLGMGAHTYAEWVNLWLSHELCGVSNDVDSMSDFLVQNNVDGSFYESGDWNEDSVVNLRPNGDGEVTVSAKGASYDNESLLQKTFTGKQSENAALWSYDVEEQFIIAGKTPVHVHAKVDNVGEGDKMMCAVLVDAADAPFATYAMGAIPEAEVVRARDESKGPADAYSTVSWKQVQASRKIITFGRMDLRNPEAGYDPASATERDEPIEANTYYDYTIWLDPTYYTVQAGHHLELYIVPFCGYSEQAKLAGEDAMLLTAAASDDAAMNLKQDYVITIQNDKSSASVPTTKRDADTNPGNPSDSDKGNNEGSDKSADGAGTQAATQQRTESASQLPRTGDDTSAGMPVALTLGAVAAIYAAVRVRTRHHQ